METPPMTTTLLVLTLNEIEGMRAIMPQVKREWLDQILIIDGQSTDGTIEWAREQGYEVVVQQHVGPRYAEIEAFPHIRGDVVIRFSPDGNSDPAAIPALIEKMKEGWDVVVASRYKDGAKSHDDDLATAFGNWFFTRVVNRLHGSHYTDAMVMYRAFRRELFYELDLHKDDGYAPEKLFGTIVGIDPLFSVRCAKRKLKVAEIGWDEPVRIGGKRKLHVIRWGAAYLTQFVRELYFWR